MTAPFSEIVVPPQWKGLEGLSGTIFLLGGTDSGKSTLARWLALSLSRKGGRTGWIDADVGQSALGPPATLNLAVVDSDSEPLPFARFFVGSTTPRGHMLPVLVGVQRLTEAARRLGCDSLVIDTDGMIAMDAGGGALKEWLIELLRPDAVVALQTGSELEHLLGPLRRRSDLLLHLLPSSPHVRRRSPEARALRRRERFRAYFADASPVAFPFTGIPVYGLEKACPGRLLSLQGRDGFSLALGVVAAVRPGELEIVTPVQGLSPVASLRLGDLRLDPATGEELA